MRTGVLAAITSGFLEKLMQQTPVSSLPQVPVSTLTPPLFGANTTSCPPPKAATTLKHKSRLKDLTTYTDACRSTMPIGEKITNSKGNVVKEAARCPFVSQPCNN